MHINRMLCRKKEKYETLKKDIHNWSNQLKYNSSVRILTSVHPHSHFITELNPMS